MSPFNPNRIVLSFGTNPKAPKVAERLVDPQTESEHVRGGGQPLGQIDDRVDPADIEASENLGRPHRLPP